MYFLTQPSPFAAAVTPWGMERVLEYIQKTYGNPPIYVHENGNACSTHKNLLSKKCDHLSGILYAFSVLPGRGTRPDMELDDYERVDYLNSYLEFVLKAVRYRNCSRHD